MSEKKLENFSRTLRNLEQSQHYQPPYDAVTEAGLVALFQVCMEQSWRAMKAALEEAGGQRSPNRFAQKGYQVRLQHRND